MKRRNVDFQEKGRKRRRTMVSSYQQGGTTAYRGEFFVFIIIMMRISIGRQIEGAPKLIIL